MVPDDYRPGEDLSLLGEGWQQVERKKWSEYNDEEYEEEEELYVTLDFGNHVNLNTLTATHEYQLVGLDSPSPFFKIGNYVFRGLHDQLIGSEILFRSSRDADDPTYTTHHPIATTSKRITMHPVVPRSSATTESTEQVPEAQQKATLPFPPAIPQPLRSVRKVNAEAGPSRTFSPEDGPPPATAPALSAAFLAQDTTDPSLDFSIPEDGLPTREMVVIGGPGRPAKYGGQQEAADKKNAERRHREMVSEIEAATFGNKKLGRPRARAKVVDLSEFGVPTWKRSKRVDKPQESRGETSAAGRGGRGRGRGRARGAAQETTPTANSPLAEVTPGSPLNPVSEMDLEPEEKGDEDME